MYPKILRLQEVMNRTGLKRSTIYKLMNDSKFPKQIMLTERCVGWIEDEIHDWIVERLASARAKRFPANKNSMVG